MPAYFFQNKKTGKKYRVIKLDKEKGEITLKGEYGVFSDTYDKERFEKLGYVFVKEDDNVAA